MKGYYHLKKASVVVFFLLFTAIVTALAGAPLKHPARLRPPDYSNLSDWAAHPWKKDFSDSVPGFVTYNKIDSAADVFFIHPTSFTANFYRAPWNASLDDEELNAKTDLGSMLNQATVFNTRCRIFAPRYRQAHLKAFILKENPKKDSAISLAYADVRSAFLYYMKHFNQGKPIIIASHSQGTIHAIKLMQEFFDGTPLQQKLICAYLVGWPVRETEFKHIPAGDSAAQTNCYVAWRSYKYGYTDGFASIVPGKIACVNPVSWRRDTLLTTVAAHKGGAHQNLTEAYPATVQAQVNTVQGILWVYAPEATVRRYGKIKNYHVGDYNLFYLDIRENVDLRISRWFSR